ncbi:phosphatidylinositol glycan anchor biosynthesis class Z [Arctopsyche grandis]|uniref:phosphatidylinositol glycan anchor biosynthesis class Z n=1 Tax=Arctopsyche grandis TaxID=121162 RepID=UPI00406D8650
MPLWWPTPPNRAGAREKEGEASAWAIKRAHFQKLFELWVVRQRPTGAKPDHITSTYWTLAALRLALIFTPQRGYIHPDEFMQTLEPIAGRALDVEWRRSWEFNNTFPLRNIALPRVFIGIPLTLLYGANDFTTEHFNIKILTPYSLLVIPRLIYCLLSFLNDYCLYKICRLYGENVSDKLLFLASSYVSIVYATHTFSNSLEMVLLSLLLLSVSDCMLTSKCVIEHSEAITDKYKQSNDVVERVQLYKLRKLLPEYSLSKCLQISTIVVVGMFNRPTFIAFAFPSIFLWLMRGLGSKYIGFKDFHTRLFVFVMCCLPSLFFMIIADSSFYGYLTISDIESNAVTINNFVVTPVNFLRYNIFAENLAEHGLHPRWLHVLVNVPILFNILGIIGLFTITKMSYRLCRGLYRSLPRIQSINGLMTFSVITPVALLSLFPHQEPRFLTPILLPVVYLYAKHIQLIPSDSEWNKRLKKFAFAVWCVCNVLLSLFFGFIHQGGVYSTANHIHNEVNSRFFSVHVITSHMYDIPQSLFLAEDAAKVHLNRDTGQRYKVAKRVFLYELGSKSLTNVVSETAKVWKIGDLKKRTAGQEFRTYLIIPNSLKQDLNAAWFNANVTSLELIEDAHFYPHISTEAPPHFPSADDQFCDNLHYVPDVSPATKMTAVERVYCYIRQFSLTMFRIERRSHFVI